MKRDHEKPVLSDVRGHRWEVQTVCGEALVEDARLPRDPEGSCIRLWLDNYVQVLLLFSCVHFLQMSRVPVGSASFRRPSGIPSVSTRTPSHVGGRAEAWSSCRALRCTQHGKSMSIELVSFQFRLVGFYRFDIRCSVQDCLMLFICPCCPAWELFAKDCIKSMHGNHVVHGPRFQVFILCTTFCSQWAKMQKLRSRNALSKCLQSLFLLLWKLWRHV